MNVVRQAARAQLSSQVTHWSRAAASLQNIEELASSEAWEHLERYTGLSIRRHLTSVARSLLEDARSLRGALDVAYSDAELSQVRRRILAFRTRFLQVETTLDFYADAINTRTGHSIGGLLRACDSLAHRSMAQLLDQLGKPTPVSLTYLDKGLGASILKAGLRLWDLTSSSPVAAIKITRHNLYRPTALIHEAGHQVAHILGWTDELAAALEAGLVGAPDELAAVWAGWASEIVADAFAFVHTGFASVAALRDVVDGGRSSAFRYVPGDPHPIAYLRVLLGVEMCRQCYGKGPWDDLALAWSAAYPLRTAPRRLEAFLRGSIAFLPEIAAVTLRQPMQALGGRGLVERIDPERVSPAALLNLERELGEALYASSHWVWTEALRLLALTGLHAAVNTQGAGSVLDKQQAWMLRLGGALEAA